MKLKSVIAAVATIWVTLVSCSVTDNPSGDIDPAFNEISATEVTNLTPDFIGTVSGLEAGQILAPGSSITLTLTPGESLYGGFAAYHMEHIHVHVGDKVYVPEFPGVDDEYVQEVSLTVPVPDKAFPIVVAYAVQQQFSPDGHHLTLEDNADGVELFGVSPNQTYKYFDCYLRTPDAYAIDKIEYKMGDGDWQNLLANWACDYVRTAVDNVYRVTVRPDYEDVTGDVVIRVNGTQHKRGKITWKNTELVNTGELPEGYSPNFMPESAVGGEQVVARIHVKDGYYLAGATSNVDGVNPECKSYTRIEFTMPEQDVEISLDIKEKITVTYEASPHITSAEIYAANDIYYGVVTDKAIPGDAIFLFVKAEQGYKPVNAVSDRGEKFKFEIYGGGFDKFSYYAQVMVPEDATSMTLRAETETAYYVDGQHIYFDGGQCYLAGEEVSFIVEVPEGKIIETVTAKDANGADVPLTMDGTYGSFTMPASNVTVTATFADIPEGEMVTVKALYDEDQYRVTSQSAAYYGALNSEGVKVAKGTTLYISVEDYYGEPFSVGVKIGDHTEFFDAKEDEDTGEFTFGRSFVFTDDAVIKVGANKNAVTF